MLMASWKNYDKRAFSLPRIPGASRPAARAKSPPQSAHAPRQPQHEDQHFGDRLVELWRNFVADLDMGQGARQHLVLLDRNVVFPGEFDDPGADDALALGDDPRRAGFVIVQRDRKLAPGLDAHSERSRKWPARAAGSACVGAPSRITISPG